MPNNIYNPWIGLNSYTEGQALYGRDEEIGILSSRIQYNTQTVVYGRSGIGKSSILCAGIFPRLRDENIIPIRIRLEHNEEAYIYQIKESLFKELSKSRCSALEIVKRHCDQEGKFLFEESLWEFFHRYEFKNANGDFVSPLIVLDQFEEIFTLEKDRKKVENFFVQLADLLNNTKPAYLTGYEETLYVQSPSYEEEELPAQKTTNKISAILRKKSHHRTEFNYIEEDNFHIILTIREDYLSYLERNTTHIPLLKHNRYCLQPINEEQAAKIIMQPCPGLVDKTTAKLIIEKVTGETDFELEGVPEISVDSAVLSLYLSRLYEKKGNETQLTPALIEKFGNNIIEDFYTETIVDFPQSVIEFLEDALLNNEGHRENISVYRALHECKELTSEMLDSLVNSHKLIRRFSYNDTARIEFIHDILCPIIKARKEKRAMLKKQEEDQRRLEEEKKKRIEIEKKAAKDRQRARKHFKVTMSLLVAAIISIGIWWLLTQYQYSEQYETFVTKNGWPVGINHISTSTKQSIPVHYRLTRKGMLPETLFGIKLGNHFDKVEILNSADEPINNIMVSSPVVSLSENISSIDDNDVKAYEFALMQRKISYWRYLPDQNGNVSRVLAYSRGDTLLFGEQYYYSSVKQDNDDEIDNSIEFSDTKTKFFNYIDKDGNSLVVRDNGICKINVTEDENGFVSGYTFYSILGAPLNDRYKNCGYIIENSADGIPQSEFPVNEFGDKRHSISFKPQITKNKNSFQIAYATGHIHTYDKQGNEITHIYKYRKNGSNYKIIASYAQQELTKYEEFKDSTLTYKYIVNSNGYVEYDISSPSGYLWQKKIIKHDKGTTVETFYGGNNPKDITHPSLYEGYHKSVKIQDKASNKRYIIEKEYLYDIDGKTLTKCDDIRHGYNAKETYYDRKTGHIIKYFTFDRDKVITSRKYYYNAKGEKYARSVISIVDKETPIRCPNWEYDGLTYYKLKYVKNDYGFIISTEGENEFGEQSLVTHDNRKYCHQILPFVKYQQDITSDSTINAEEIFLGIETPLSSEHKVNEIHMLTQNCHLLKYGFHDGDIILSKSNGVVKVAGFDFVHKTYVTRIIKIEAKLFNSYNDYEIDTYYLTAKEWSRIKI